MSNKDEIKKTLILIFYELFGNDIPTIKENTSSADIDGWDSFNNLNLIAASEEAFKIRISAREIENLMNVGDLINLIYRKTRP